MNSSRPFKRRSAPNLPNGSSRELKSTATIGASLREGKGDAFNPDVVSRMTASWMKAAGPKGSCHLLRHTCATYTLEGGADIRDIQQLLGHEKLETTAIHTEVTIRPLQEAHARCHPDGPSVRDVTDGGLGPSNAYSQR